MHSNAQLFTFSIWIHIAQLMFCSWWCLTVESTTVAHSRSFRLTSECFNDIRFRMYKYIRITILNVLFHSFITTVQFNNNHDKYNDNLPFRQKLNHFNFGHSKNLLNVNSHCYITSGSKGKNRIINNTLQDSNFYVVFSKVKTPKM